MGVQTTEHSNSSKSRSNNQDPNVPSEEELTSLFEEAMKRSSTETTSKGMTQQEQQNFLKAMKEPEFRSLLNDYMKEISDPTHRAETEKYLSQLEQEQRVPHDKILIKPIPGFVVKTKWQDRKVFINVCSNEKLQPPSSTTVAKTATSPAGTSWSLPYSIGPERVENDKGGVHAIAYDVCFHPRTVLFAMQQPSYQEMVIKTCLDAIEKQLQLSSPKDQISKKYHVLKGVKYKSGEPVTMCLSKPKDMEKKEKNDTKKKEKNDTKKKEKNVTTKVEKNDTAMETTTKPLIEEISSSPTLREPALKTIEYRIVYRGKFELGDHLITSSPNISRPKELVVHIPFPGHTSAKGIDLDVNEQMVQITCPGYKNVSITLPFPIVENKGKASFEKKSSTLKIVLPVQPPQVDTKENEEKLLEQEETLQEKEENIQENKVASLEENNEIVQENKVASLEENNEIVQENKLASLEVNKDTVLKPTIPDDPFARFRECALMVANDPMYLPRSTKDDSLKQENDLEDLPPLESCSEDEEEKEETTVNTPQTPLYSIKETAQCRSYLIEVSEINPSTVQLHYPTLNSFTLQFTTLDHNTYELVITDLCDPWDLSTIEWDVASENMILIVHKNSTTSTTSISEEDAIIDQVESSSVISPSIHCFQNELLYELD